MVNTTKWLWLNVLIFFALVHIWCAHIIQIMYFAFYKHREKFYQRSVYPPEPESPRVPTPLPVGIPVCFHASPSGLCNGSSRPSILIPFQQTGQFVGPNPLQHKRHNGAYSGPLSSLDLLLPLGLPHFLIEESAWTDRF